MKASTVWPCLVLMTHLCFMTLIQAQAPSLIGQWTVSVELKEFGTRTLHFEAKAEGKGTLTLQDARVSPTPAAAKWTQGGKSPVKFSGPVEFPIGNVGRLAGTLVCQGKFDTENSIAGEAALFAPDQDLKDPKAVPSRTGTFKAKRVTETQTPR